MNSIHVNSTLRRTRVARILTGLGAVTIALSSTAGAASASNEFPANPAATLTAACSKWLGARLHVDYTNVGGQSAAEFTLSVDNFQYIPIVVTADTTASSDVAVDEGKVIPVMITAPDMTPIVTTIGPLNCHTGTTTISVDCVNGSPVMTATATNTGESMNTATLVINNDVAKPSKKTVSPGATETFSYPIPDGVPYTGQVSFDEGGQASNISGTPMCDPPTTESTIPETTVPPTTAPPTTVAPTVPPTTAPPATVLVDAPTTVALTFPVGTVLPSTGKSSAAIAWIAALALACGLVIVRTARRPRSTR